MADFLDEKRREIASRLDELRPLVDESNRLEKAAAALAGINGPRRGNDLSSRRGSSRVASPRAAKARVGRPPGTGARSKEALELVTRNPGISIAQLAERMGIKPNYLYRVLPSLEAEGKVSKSNGGWAASAADAGRPSGSTRAKSRS